MRTTGQKRVLGNQLKQLKVDDQINQANRQLENIRNIFIQQGTPLDQGQKDTLNALIAQRDVYHAQLEILKEQMSVGARIGEAINTGLESGLQTNIYDLLTGKESSFKDAVLKTVQSVFDSLAKRLSEMFTEKIMGAIGIETKAQKNQRLILEAHTKGATVLGDTIRTEGERMAASIDAAIKKGTEEGAYPTPESTDPTVVRDPNKGQKVETLAEQKFNDAMTQLGKQAERQNKTTKEEVVPPLDESASTLDKIYRLLLDRLPRPVAIPSGTTPTGTGGTARGGRNNRNRGGAMSTLPEIPYVPPVRDSDFIDEGPVGPFPQANARGTLTNPLIVQTVDAALGASDASSFGFRTVSMSKPEERKMRTDKKTADLNNNSAKSLNDGAANIDASSKIFTKAGAKSTAAAGAMQLAGGDMTGAGLSMIMAAGQMLIAAITQSASATAGAIGGAIGGGSGLIMAADGGVFSKGKKRSYQPGGIASGPTSGYPAILHGTEAVVPLPDGKTIPVQMSGGGGTNNVTVNVNMETGQTSSENSEGRDTNQLGKVVAAAVQAELQHQKRPGGILSPFGAS